MLKKLPCLFALLVLGSGICMGAETERADKDTSYAVGVLLGLNLKQLGLQFDYAALMDALKKSIETDDPGMPQEKAVELVQAAYENAVNKLKADNLKKSLSFLEENAKRKGVKTTESGLQYEILSEGKGAKPTPDKVVLVNYIGTLIDGKEFDNSWKSDEPASIPLSRVIPGWSEGIQLMNVGSRFKLYIPPDLAYGEEGAGEEIPPNSVLIFEVELLEIEEE